MAKQPNIDADELKRQVGSIFSRAVEAFGEVKDVVVRTSQLGKIKLDSTFIRRERDRLFQRLGEELFDLAEDGRIALPEELSPIVAQLRELESRIEEQEREIASVHAESELYREQQRVEEQAARAYEKSGAPEEDTAAAAHEAEGSKRKRSRRPKTDEGELD